MITLKTGERVIEDPESTTERVMLWFYLVINIGGFMGVATAYSEKYVGVSDANCYKGAFVVGTNGV